MGLLPLGGKSDAEVPRNRAPPATGLAVGSTVRTGSWWCWSGLAERAYLHAYQDCTSELRFTVVEVVW